MDIADQHFTDLRSHIARSSNELDTQLNELSLNLDKRISFMFGRLNRGLNLHENNDDYFKKMKQMGEQLDVFCKTAVGEEYESIIRLVDTCLYSIIEESSMCIETASLNDIFKLRLYVQSLLLQNASNLNDSKICTIADDMDQNFGIYYFVLDKKLLDRYYN